MVQLQCMEWNTLLEYLHKEGQPIRRHRREVVHDAVLFEESEQGVEWRGQGRACTDRDDSRVDAKAVRARGQVAGHGKGRVEHSQGQRDIGIDRVVIDGLCNVKERR